LVEAVWLKSLKINMSKDNNSMALDQGLGFFSWQPTVSVDGTDRPLAVSEVMADRFNFADGGDSDDDMGNAPRLVAFTMPSGQNIYWDPQLGASDTQITDQFGPASDALSAPKVSGLVLLFTMMFSMFFLF
jgi:hypothetical protein